MRGLAWSCMLLAPAMAGAQPAPAALAGTGQQGMLVMTSAAAAAPAALALLDEGGSAMDVAVAAALSQVVWCAGAWSSLAGIVALLYHDAASQQTVSLDGGFARPAQDGARLVPGMVPGLAQAHARFGRLPWARLLDPAIGWAERGVPVHPLLARLLAWRTPVLAADPGARAALLDADGRPPVAGQLLRQGALADTLRSLAAIGPRHMVDGAWAKQFAQRPGAPAPSDLQGYRAQWTEPLAGHFADHAVRTVGLPQLGGLCLLESLALLDDAPAALRSPRSAAATVRMVRAGEPCYAGFARLQPAPAHRLQPARIAALRATALGESGLPLAARLTGAALAGHSDIVVAADRAGNLAILAHSINTTAWGARPLFVQGVSVSDAHVDQAALVRQVAPAAHVPHALNPSLLLRNGRPVVAMASIGGSVFEAMLQASVDLTVDAASPAAVVAAPRYLRPLWPRLGAAQFALLGTLVLGAGGLALLVRPQRPAVRVLAWLACGAALAWAMALLAAAAFGIAAPLRWLDRPAAQAAMAAPALGALARALLGWRCPDQRWAWKLAVTLAALLLLVSPPLLRGALVPVTLVEAGRFDAATLAAWRGAGLAVAEVAADAPLGYWAGIAIASTGQPRFAGAVTPGLGGAVLGVP